MNNNNTEISPSHQDEAIDLINQDVPVNSNSQNDTRKSDMLRNKMLTQHRLLRWCTLILTLSTLIIIWRYITILILSIWLSSICRPVLEWLVNHL
jgi:hypothetical protein